LFYITDYHEAKSYNAQTTTLRVRGEARSDASRDWVGPLRAALHGGVQEMHAQVAAERIDQAPSNLQMEQSNDFIG